MSRRQGQTSDGPLHEIALNCLFELNPIVSGEPSSTHGTGMEVQGWDIFSRLATYDHDWVYFSQAGHTN